MIKIKNSRYRAVLSKNLVKERFFNISTALFSICSIFFYILVFYAKSIDRRESMHFIITVQSLRPIVPDKKTWNEISLNKKSIFCCLDITGNIPALFLSRQSISIFVRSFVKITCKCCLGSLLSELYCLSSVV